jgi:predicted nucleotidyltransferase
VEVEDDFSPEEHLLFADLLRRMHNLYPRRLLAVKLVGSRARDEAMERSDVDVLVFLDRCDYEVEVPKLEEVAYQLTLKHGLGAVSLSPMTYEQFLGLDSKRPGITEAFRRDAVCIWP